MTVTVEELVAEGKALGERAPAFKGQWAAEAVMMLLKANGGEMEEGPLSYLALSTAEMADQAEIDLDEDDVRVLVAQTIHDRVPLPDDVYAAMVATYDMEI